MTNWKAAIRLERTKKRKKEETESDDEEFVVVSSSEESSESDESEEPESPPVKKSRTPKVSPKKPTVSVADFFKRTAVKKDRDAVPRAVPPVVQPAPAVSSPEQSPPTISSKLKNCTIVFSGEMSMDRDTAKSLAESAGAKVTSAVSGKTTYLVLGSVLEDGRAVEEGSKYKKMKELEKGGKSGPKPLTEAEFLHLVGRQESGPVDAPTVAAEPLVSSSSVPLMWVDKYEPQSLSDYVGNKSNVSKLCEWLKRWISGSRPSGAIKPSFGRGGNTEAKAVLISGPPGVGKSLLARLACQELGLEKIEFNASDYRNKAHIDLIGIAVSNAKGVFSSSAALRPQCLVMDECDGMSSGDRGGNAALIQVIKKTAIPIICICNDRMSPKVRSLANYCYDLRFVKPSKVEVVDRCLRILRFENMSHIAASVVGQIVEGADCDIRQSINQLEGDSFDWKSTIVSFEKKDRSTMLTPFDATRLIFAPQPNMSLNDRLDMFFVDYDLIPLLVQQNYLKCFAPGEIGNAVKSAALISQADCISRAIRAEQNWSLLPEFGLIGSVFVPPKPEDGIGAPYPEFPVWLGKNSHSRKISRIVQELECIVSTTTSVGSKNILLSNYPHVMYVSFVNELVRVGNGGLALPTLDALGVHKNDLLDLLTELLLPWQKNLYEDIDSKTKAAITRICNNHHMMLKSGAAHFRSAKSSSVSTGLSLSDERGDAKVEEEDEEEDVSRKKKDQTDELIKQAKKPKPKSRTKK
jgi:replication factor C subunit 1